MKNDDPLYVHLLCEVKTHFANRGIQFSDGTDREGPFISLLSKNMDLWIGIQNDGLHVCFHDRVCRPDHDYHLDLADADCLKQLERELINKLTLIERLKIVLLRTFRKTPHSHRRTKP